MNKNKADNLFIHPWQYDLPKFYEDKTYVINTSHREGNPVAVLEAMAMGLKPLIYDWIGAEETFGKENIFKTVYDFKRLLDGKYEPFKYREQIQENYNFENTYRAIEALVFAETTPSQTKPKELVGA